MKEPRCGLINPVKRKKEGEFVKADSCRIGFNYGPRIPFSPPVTVEISFVNLIFNYLLTFHQFHLILRFVSTKHRNATKRETSFKDIVNYYLEIRLTRIIIFNYTFFRFNVCN